MLRLLVLVATSVVCSYAASSGIVILTPNGSNVTGTVTFTEVNGTVVIEGTVINLTEGLHGFHVHELGDLSNGCTSTGSHYNPYNQTHGGRNVTNRHVGDLGNIEANSTGIAVFSFSDSVISLSGTTSIIGRAIVVHEDPDDLGLGNETDSLTTGHAGARLACGIVGILTESENSGGSFTHAAPSAMLLLLGLISVVYNIV